MRWQVVTSVGPEDEFARQADVRETWMECSREESVRESESEEDGVQQRGECEGDAWLASYEVTLSV